MRGREEEEGRQTGGNFIKLCGYGKEGCETTETPMDHEGRKAANDADDLVIESAGSKASESEKE